VDALAKALPIRRIVLVEPRSPDLHIFSRFAMPRIGVVLLGTILRDLGYDVQVLVEECLPLDLDAMARADLVGISAITPTVTRAYELADFLRARGVPVVMGGPHPTHCADEALRHADYVVRGEGEEALPALLEALARGEGLDQVPSLSYLDGGEARHNPLAEPVRDLDRFPDPDLGLVAGFKNKGFLGGRRIVPLQTSRGCPHDCSFCTVTTTFGRKLRYRSPERVAAEMARYDLERTHFFIYDDNFTANRRRAREMLAAIRTLPQRPRWSVQVRAELGRDEDLVREMREAGCDTIYVGLESVNQASLESAKKRQELDDVSRNLKTIGKYGIDIHGMFVFGFDTDDARTMERTVAFAREHDLLSVQLLILTPLPGSRWAREMEETGRILHRDWSLYDTHHVVFRPAHVTRAELQRWQEEGHRRFYSPARVLRCLLRGRVFRAAVAFYALKMTRAWRKRHRDYLAALAAEAKQWPRLVESAPALLGLVGSSASAPAPAE
jgi:radical SAM superfamily enzyme YgiQ (UPF0313 family)